MAQRSARRDWRSGGPRFKSHPRLTFQSWSSYQLNQLGSKAASDSTLKQLTTCGVSNTCTFYFTSLFDLKLLRSATLLLSCSNHQSQKTLLLFSHIIESSQSKNLWHTINHLLHKIAAPSLPLSGSLSSLPQYFEMFFSDKIHKLRTLILTVSTTPLPYFPPPFKPPDLSFF